MEEIRRFPALRIVEVDGDRYASLEMAQVVALGDVALAVAGVVREGLAKGKLVVVDGRVQFVEDGGDDE
jgi:hypothetical protein